MVEQILLKKKKKKQKQNLTKRCCWSGGGRVQLQSCWSGRQSAVAELLEWWRRWKIKEKTEIKKKPTKRVNPHDPQVNPTQTIFKWVGFGLTRFLTGLKIPYPYPYFTPRFGRVNGSGPNFARSMYQEMKL